MKPPPLFSARVLAVTTLTMGFLVGQTNATTFTIDSLDGDITANETIQFINSANTFTPVTNNWGNNMADHSSGVQTEGIGRMYEATHNVTILNQLIKFCEVFMSH